MSPRFSTYLYRPPTDPIQLVVVVAFNVFCQILLIFLHKFQAVVRWTMGLTVLLCLIYLILFLIQRMPLWLFWEGWKDKTPRGVIVDGNAMGISHGTLNVALDIWMLILPLSQRLKSGVKFNKKVGVVAMFSSHHSQYDSDSKSLGLFSIVERDRSVPEDHLVNWD
ncbi:uncharacterized protein NECHADRAFT_87975 [Fusarium vanettenii 77-13-4]|uniref:Rhodopsin domain-containing protein n=1 Tax=Fusarium vanettenii (strain ATCC MYA-4622 / CBS 123669 / FGSC 9596 / NRRL 45880 / 77-13-4) TaxID=660122 RepID=C7ZJY2_FUSV7|nr:uncharacterized protein NECHADRAFT_87975 [Fusarium vanettenii 77-13-4]EEU35672.1 hypothetical protein NECHADRAFT_87975 [Fusarium vanettenii 77-13-4]